MDRRKTGWIIALMLAAAVVTGAGCFCLGKRTALSHYQAEQALNVLLNRSELEGLGEHKETIYVTGHKNPDSDTVGSSIAYAFLLRQLGYDARPVVLGTINSESKYILKAAGVDIPERLEDASGRTMILMDHSEYAQSSKGLQQANIISIIDHHGLGSVMTGNSLIYDARPLGAAATIVWIRYRNYGLEPDKSTALVMVGAILSDTGNFQSTTTTFADRAAVKALSALAGISDTDAFYRDMYKARISYEGMTDEEIFFKDYKEYVTGGTKYAVACVEVYDEKDARNMSERMKKIIPSASVSAGMDMTFAQINIFHDGVSVTYLVPSGEKAAKILESAFGDKAAFDGTAYVLKPGISRKQTLIPAITDFLNVHPKE